MQTALTAADEFEPEARAPLLPVEHHVVAMTRAIEAAKVKCDTALLLFQHAPRSDDTFVALAELQGCAARAADAYRNYFEVITCKGQA